MRGPEGLIGGTAPGTQPRLNAARGEALAGTLARRSKAGFARCGALADRRSCGMAAAHICGHGKPADTEPRVACARLSQAAGAAPAPCPGGGGDCRVQKNLPAVLAEVRQSRPPGPPVEPWWQDAARVGQKTKITRRWAEPGTRPAARTDQRTASAHISGAICPARGKAAGLVMPHCNTKAMAAHPADISRDVASGAQALPILDHTGWQAPAAAGM